MAPDGRRWQVDAPPGSAPKAKPVVCSRELLVQPALPEMVNELGHVKAGHMLKLIDVAGALSAYRHAEPPGFLVTASMDRTNFVNPVLCWELITLDSRVTRVWNTSMETRVCVSARDFRTGEVRPVATSYLVYVGLDRARAPVTLPALDLLEMEEYRLAHTADLRRDNRRREDRELPFLPIGFDPADDPLTLDHLAGPTDANVQSNVFGGVILELIDRAASQAASRQALGASVVGVRQDRMSFLAPAFIGETIRARALVTLTWRTYMELQVEVSAINPNQEKPRPIASSYVVYVKLGSDQHPAEVPPWEPRGEVQQRRAEAADRRRENRITEERLASAPIAFHLPWPERLNLLWRRLTRPPGGWRCPLGRNAPLGGIAHDCP